MNTVEKCIDISDRGSICLKLFIVEPILIACIDKASFTEIRGYVQRVIPNITESEVKEHLYYLITDSFVNYTGKNKLYSISQVGIDFLDIFYSQKNVRILDNWNPIVKVE